MAPPCGLCNNFRRKQTQYRVAFDCKVDELLDAARQGCPVCSFMFEAMIHFEPKFGGLDKVGHVSVWGPTVEQRKEEHFVEAEVCLADSRKVMLEFFMGDSGDPGRFGAPMKVTPPVPGDTSSDQSFNWAVQRLAACVKYHSQCPDMKEVVLPARVLDLGLPDEQGGAKLLHTSNRLGTYACLSHCWGGVQSCTTTCSNLNSRIAGIAWESLPQTFRDAIVFTRRLGLRYLWIDSLCIMQDDPLDWKRESGKMASIYQNAHITLAATKAPDGCGGCFSVVSPIDRDHELAGLRRFVNSQIRVFVREKIRHLDHAGQPDSADNAVSELPLLNRAWAYQERLLSSRVIHFCRRELVWECREYSSCECASFRPKTEPKKEYASFFWNPEGKQQDGPHPGQKLGPAPGEERGGLVVTEDGYKPYMKSTEGTVSFNREKKGAGSEMAPDELASAVKKYLQAEIENQPPTNQTIDARKKRTIDEIRLWHRLVMQYSALYLTVQSDRLPAIAGLAKQMVGLRGGDLRYLAGVWSSSLEPDLLWHVDESLAGRSASRPTPPNAPSWSWASVNGKVSFWDEELVDHNLAIVESQCDPVRRDSDEVDPFGQVTGGRLVVSTDGLEVMKLVHTYAEGNSSTSHGVHYMLSLDGKNIPFLADYDLSNQGPGYIGDGETVYCLEFKKGLRAGFGMTGSKFPLSNLQLARCPTLDSIMLLSKVQELDFIGNTVPENMAAAEKRLELPSEATDQGWGILGPVRRDTERKTKYVEEAMAFDVVSEVRIPSELWLEKMGRRIGG
ncbi:HET-domain-containing protein [Zalerion maritima]|uniref:HET-domain-containing protein n=1 Tax=Zalerion maritima TaxID=339359 RepID=A0AAD5RPU0_9PEZI|nr:HET-domain-containing protein [Zalerion maritima]